MAEPSLRSELLPHNDSDLFIYLLMDNIFCMILWLGFSCRESDPLPRTTTRGNWVSECLAKQEVVP